VENEGATACARSGCGGGLYMSLPGGRMHRKGRGAKPLFSNTRSNVHALVTSNGTR